MNFKILSTTLIPCLGISFLSAMLGEKEPTNPSNEQQSRIGLEIPASKSLSNIPTPTSRSNADAQATLSADLDANEDGDVQEFNNEKLSEMLNALTKEPSPTNKNKLQRVVHLEKMLNECKQSKKALEATFEEPTAPTEEQRAGLAMLNRKIDVIKKVLLLQTNED